MGFRKYLWCGGVAVIATLVLVSCGGGGSHRSKMGLPDRSSQWDELLARLGGRWSCPRCGAVYHQRNYRPRQEGVCDECGAQLYQRDDDKPEVARQRLDVYFRQAAPLIDYYRQGGKLREVNGESDVEAVGRELLTALHDP